MHSSIATIDAPEFINLQPLDLNPLMSSCEIKVLYIGGNRNRSFITKEVATEMSKSLRGAPIVGYYKDEKEDFRDHGEKVVLDDEGIHFECLTKPYGFVAPDAKVWFQKFQEQDSFGNDIIREYLMTTGYLWTGQFEECKSAVAEGKPQSMELDEKTLDGKWSVENQSNIEFFIINDAIFSKLCILGDDVEPCFEGASVTAPDVSKNFSLDDTFKNTLFTMMEDLKKFAVSEGGIAMSDFEKNGAPIETPEPELDFAKDDEEKKKKAEPEDGKKDDNEKKDDEDKKEEPVKEDKDEDKEKEKKNKHSLEETCQSLTEQLEQLQNAFELLTQQNEEASARLEEYAKVQEQAELKRKEELIQSFSMLSEEDKKDVIENKATYSYDEIESKLSVIGFRKGVNFGLDKEEEVIEEPKKGPSTYSLPTEDSSIPAWVSALKNAREKNI